MDASRFDSLTRSLATRISRRGALRGGLGAAAGAVGVRAVRPVAAATDPSLKRYSTVHQFESDAEASDVKRALEGLIPQLKAIPGFIDYSVINAAGNHYITLITFVDNDGMQTAVKLEATWIADNAAEVLPKSLSQGGGPVILDGSIGAGCPCITGTENPCNSDQLVCCGSSESLGGSGFCVDAQYGCGSTSTPACTDDGNACLDTCAAGTDCADCCSGTCLTDGTCGTPTEPVPCSAAGAACTQDSDCCQGSCSEDAICYCNDPSRPDIGCSCDAGDPAACGGRTDLCCEGTCISPLASCEPPANACANPGDSCGGDADCCQGNCGDSGICYCTEPDRPEVGCSCDPSDPNACGGRTDLCCVDHCISPMAQC